MANVKPDIVLRILFLTMSNTDIDFEAWDLQWRSYATEDVRLIIRQVELIGKKKFAAIAFDPEHKAFIVNVATLSIDSGDEMHLSKKV